MRSFIRTRIDRANASLFFVPMAFVVGGVLLGILGIFVDGQLSDDVTFPLGVVSTVDSARAVLSTVASATMAFAGISFSVALLVFQQSSSQFSPRVIQGLFQDGFNKRVIGIVVGTFTYCLVVLRSVRSSLEEGGGDAVIPTLSVTVAVLFGLVTVLAIVAFIDHNAHRMDVSEILHDVEVRTTERIMTAWPERDANGEQPTPGVWAESSVAEIAGQSDGWVQRIDVDPLLEAIPEASTLRLETAPSRYTVSGTVLATLSPRPDDDGFDRISAAVRSGVIVGPSRTLTQDPAYGLRQLVDVALKALSPGINDPTTAQDAIFHIAAVLHEMLEREPPPQVVNGDDGRCVLLISPTHQEMIDLAYNELRLVAGSQPTVCEYLLESIRLAGQGVPDSGVADGSARAALCRQAQLVVAECERSDAPEWDFLRVKENYEERFGPWSKPTG